MQQLRVQFDLLEPCPICNDPFQRQLDRLPRLMACGHSVCSNCIKNQIRNKGFLLCPLCNCIQLKKTCSLLKVNTFYLDLIESLEVRFGKICVLQTKKPDIKRQSLTKNIFRNNRDRSQMNQQHEELIKCKNSQCPNQTDLIFCSEQCKTLFQEKQTNQYEKNELERRNNDSQFEI